MILLVSFAALFLSDACNLKLYPEEEECILSGAHFLSASAEMQPNLAGAAVTGVSLTSVRVEQIKLSCKADQDSRGSVST